MNKTRVYADMDDRMAEKKLDTQVGGKKFHIRFSSVITYFVICVTLVGILVSYVNLTEMSSEANELKTQLSAAQNEQKVLENKLEQVTSLAVVEDFAKNTLGMTKVQNHQLEYNAQSGESKTEVLKQKGGLITDLYQAVSKTFNAVLEYLS